MTELDARRALLRLLHENVHLHGMLEEMREEVSRLVERVRRHEPGFTGRTEH